MTPETKTPSAGAMRAADAVIDQLEAHFRPGSAKGVLAAICCAIIDRETRCAELEAALRDLCRSASRGHVPLGVREDALIARAWLSGMETYRCPGCDQLVAAKEELLGTLCTTCSED